jgi:hypothetical protein
MRFEPLLECWDHERDRKSRYEDRQRRSIETLRWKATTNVKNFTTTTTTTNMLTIAVQLDWQCARIDFAGGSAAINSVAANGRVGLHTRLGKRVRIGVAVAAARRKGRAAEEARRRQTDLVVPIVGRSRTTIECGFFVF